MEMYHLHPWKKFGITCDPPKQTKYYIILKAHGNTRANAIGNIFLIQFILLYGLSYYFQASALGNVLVSLFILFYCECSWKYFKKYP